MDIGFWTFIAIIVIAGNYFNYKTTVAKLGDRMDDMEDSNLQKELDNIKQRLAVLEKIITDKNYDLNEEFSELHKRK